MGSFFEVPYTVLYDRAMDLFGDLPPPSKPADFGELLGINKLGDYSK